MSDSTIQDFGKSFLYNSDNVTLVIHLNVFSMLNQSSADCEELTMFLNNVISCVAFAVLPVTETRLKLHKNYSPGPHNQCLNRIWR